MKSSITICFSILIVFFYGSSAAAATLAEQYTSLAIQGDLRQARALFELAEPALSPADRELAMLFHRRFIERSEPPSQRSGNTLIDEITAVYRDHWADSLLSSNATADPNAPANALLDTLRAHGWPGLVEPPAAASDTFELVEAALAAQGVHALAVPAPPLQDLLIWNTQATSEFEVELTDTVRSVRVVFMSDFYSQGWKHFATLGLATTTGWVEHGMLYCVEWAYAPGTETFDVSYLKHETRHLADLEQFPGLPSVDLEYRAKLTELAFASSTQRRLLDDFTAKSAANPHAPHAEANDRVTRDLWRELYGKPFEGGEQAWMSVSRGKVNRAARRLLERNTAELMRRR